jgi:hypothetical protein
MAEERHPSPAEETRRLYEDAEKRTGRAFEQLVSRDSFGELLARLTENTVALTKIGTEMFDLMLRNLRLAGRQDIIRLARQLGRTEDKIERLLQEIERLEDKIDANPPTTSQTRTTTTRKSSSANGQSGQQGARRAASRRRSGGSS